MKQKPILDGEQLLEDLKTLAQFGGSPGGAMNRVAYSPADQEGRAWVATQMHALGLETRTDPAGNTIGLYRGQMPHLLPIAIGSHTDTVPEGGRYDGALGVLAALACIRALREANIQLRHPIEVINFAAEEATMSGGTTGSQAMAGLLNPAIFEKAAWDGRLVKAHLQEAGFDPAIVLQAKRPPDSLAAFMELHIEQSDVLEQANIPIAVVEGIVGIRRYTVTFHGYANHAGTTPMDRRQDALVMAAPFITFVHELATQQGIVGTVGKLTVHPGAPNVIPGQVDLIVEIRGLDTAKLNEVETQLARQAQEWGAKFEPVINKPPVQSDSRIIDALTAACEELSLSFLKMPSGAGHDAMCMASLCPQAMIFVPSQGGVSHSPDEYTDPESCVNGARVLLAALLKLDTMLDIEG